MDFSNFGTSTQHIYKYQIYLCFNIDINIVATRSSRYCVFYFYGIRQNIFFCLLLWKKDFLYFFTVFQKWKHT